MPLETDAVADVPSLPATNDDLAPLRPTKVVLAQGGNVGAALRQARETLGLATEDIAQATRVRAAHISALEAFDLEALPSRPFTVGFVRAYARSLGLEPEAVVARFRAEAPRLDDQLRSPAGLHLQKPRRFGRIAILVVVVLGAVVTWNLVRHAYVARNLAKVAAAPARTPTPRTLAIAEPAHLGAPLPAPAEAASPPAYETPGLAAAGQGAAGALAPDDAVGKPFVPAGAIFGAAGPNSGLILQARTPTSLIVRGQGGAVYFARQLAAGQAWRAPTMAGLTADVGNPAAVEVFSGGVSRGALTDPQTPLAKLGQ
jgi:transcriptional regulator with XRE-family HTH domain